MPSSPILIFYNFIKAVKKIFSLTDLFYLNCYLYLPSLIKLIQYFSKNLGSEVYVLDIPEENIFAKFHSQPGCILLVNTVQKKIISNGKSKAQFANLYP